MRFRVLVKGDIPITLTKEEFVDTFTGKEIELLLNGNEIEWKDEAGEIHLVSLLYKEI